MLDRLSPPTQSIELAKDFVKLMTGLPDTVMRLRFIHDSDTSTTPTAEREGTIDQLWPEVIESQRQGYGVFYFMNECKSGPGSGYRGCAKDADIQDNCRALATDHDKGLPEKWEWHVFPRIVVHTSRAAVDGEEVQKGQALWPVIDLAKTDFKSAQLRLAAHYGTDTAICNPSRVLRLPGTLHLKSKPQLVTFEDCSDIWDGKCKLAEIMHGLPDLPKTKEKKLSAPKERKSSAPKEKKSSATNTPVAPAHLRMELGFIDPDVPYEKWRNIVAAIRATPIIGDEHEIERRKIAIEWSRGQLDRDNRFKDALPSRYSGDQATNKVFDTMPPRDGGVTFGTIYHAAKEAGYVGPPSAQSPSEVFGTLFNQAPAAKSDNANWISQKKFLLDVRDIFAWPDPEELVDGFIMCGENVCLYGQPKVGKTFIALDLALSIAANVPAFEQLPVRRTGAVVYLSGEGHGGMKRRVKAWAQTRGIADAKALPFYYKAEVPNTTAGIAECQRYIDGIRGQLGSEPVLVVIDTMARSMTGLNENDAGDVGRYLALTEGLRSGLNCPILTLAHSGKDETKGIRGSNASTAGFDAIWVAEMNEANKTVKIESKWLKDADELGPFCFRLKHVPVEGMINGKGAVLEYVPLDEFKKTTEEPDPFAPTNVHYMLMELGAVDRESGVTSTALVERFVSRPENESDDEWRDSKTLSDRTSGRCKRALSLAGYAHKGQGSHNATLWYLPSRLQDTVGVIHVDG